MCLAMRQEWPDPSTGGLIETQGDDYSERLCLEIRAENRFEVICRVSITSGDERPVVSMVVEVRACPRRLAT